MPLGLMPDRPFDYVGTGATIADLMLRQGAAQAQTRGQGLAALGQGLAGVGNVIGQALEARKQQQAEAEIGNALGAAMNQPGASLGDLLAGVRPEYRPLAMQRMGPVLQAQALGEERRARTEQMKAEQQGRMRDTLGLASRDILSQMDKDADGGVDRTFAVVGQLAQQGLPGMDKVGGRLAEIRQAMTAARANNDPETLQRLAGTFRNEFVPILQGYGGAGLSKEAEDAWEKKIKAQAEAAEAARGKIIDGPDGSKYILRPGSDKPEPLIAGSAPKQNLQHVETAQGIRAFNPQTGELGPVIGQSRPREGDLDPLDGGSGPAPSASGAAGDEFLKALPPARADVVRLIAEGRYPVPTGRAATSKYWQGIFQQVAQYDPTFDAGNYSARSAARRDFTSGASAKSINALNTVVGHLGDLEEKVGALGNTNSQYVNEAKNWLKTKFGATSVTNFETLRKGVTDELTRVWRQSGGTESDIQAWKESLDASHSPAQLRETMATIGGMLESKLSAFENQRDQALGVGGRGIKIVTDESRKVLDRLEGKSPEKKQGAAPTAPQAAGPRVGERRNFNGKVGEWDGKGWRAVP